MKPIIPAKRRLAVALAVAVKNYARLQDRADELFEEAEYYNISGPVGVPWSVFRKVENLQAQAVIAILDASAAFTLRKKKEGAFLSSNGTDVWSAERIALIGKRFRRAVVMIAERGGVWRYDEDLPKLLKTEGQNDAD